MPSRSTRSERPTTSSTQSELVEERLVLWSLYFYAALGYMLVSFAGGLLMALLQLVKWNPLQGIE